MKRMMVVLTAVLLISSVRAQQQGTPQPQVQAETPQFVFYEAINLVDQDSTRSRIDIPYRIDNNFFIAVKNTEASLQSPFMRRGEVLIELLDKNGMSKARDISRFTNPAFSTESLSDEKNWHHGIASFSVEPGEYTIVFEIDDLESERKFLERNKKIEAARFAGTTLLVSTPVFIQTVRNDTLMLQNFGGNIGFGSTASLYLQLYSDVLTAEPVRVEYTISTQPFMFQDPKVMASDTINQLPLLQPRPSVGAAENSAPTYILAPDDGGENTSAILVSLGAEKLPLRPFMLEMRIMQGTLSATLKKPFLMVWPEMPSSLRDVDFALEALRHITREEELDSLRRGQRDARLRSLEEFWKQKDRTPDTDYNEVMVEYYRRVDYTMRTFSSMKGGDGYKTDRGRIYILYGPPSKTERSLDPNAGYVEVWLYEKLGRKFVFRDQSRSGNYTLVATQNL
ncbi:MAG: GWxTD domain-containing protein [Bacteroidetes bacterium]|nr:GWxTD domain-containing protein [Bacteroidota bacterium]MCW5897492.1 GWxTD domain-containing protein [Bacteroidota bacterium]